MADMEVAKLKKESMPVIKPSSLPKALYVYE
jgi:hypothetical protein